MRAKYDANGNFVLSLRDKNINEIDNELNALYVSTLEGIASRYEAGGLDWLNKTHPTLYANIAQAEDKLNKEWDRSLEGKATTDNFKAALSQWHEIQLKGLEKYKSGQLNN